MSQKSEPLPIVKWAGGKTRLLPELLKRVPPKMNRYVEPFAGGAALFFAVHSRAKSALLVDSNEDLINMYDCVSRNVDKLVQELKRHQGSHSSARYYELRDRWNGTGKWGKLSRAAAFIYLNKTCFNGLWRVNRNGQFNVPMGRYTNPIICDEERLRAAAPILRAATLKCADYRAPLFGLGEGDFVYFDPPYDTKKDSFTGYTSTGFGVVEQAQLAEVAQSLAARGAKVMLSNADTALIREIYQRIGFKLQKVSCGRSIAGRGDSRASARELIITSPNLGFYSTRRHRS